jgi:hypothetical protein
VACSPINALARLSYPHQARPDDLWIDIQSRVARDLLWTTFRPGRNDGPAEPGRASTGPARADSLFARDAVLSRDPLAPYASGVCAALPYVKIAVDKCRLVAPANKMVTNVRQRVTRELLGVAAPWPIRSG